MRIYSIPMSTLSIASHKPYNSVILPSPSSRQPSRTSDYLQTPIQRPPAVFISALCKQHRLAAHLMAPLRRQIPGRSLYPPLYRLLYRPLHCQTQHLASGLQPGHYAHHTSTTLQSAPAAARGDARWLPPTVRLRLTVAATAAARGGRQPMTSHGRPSREVVVVTQEWWEKMEVMTTQ